ncbi:hypothetical protein D3C76_1444040 [compost metagenome]
MRWQQGQGLDDGEGDVATVVQVADPTLYHGLLIAAIDHVDAGFPVRAKVDQAGAFDLELCQGITRQQ